MIKAAKEYQCDTPTNFTELFKTQLDSTKTQYEKCLEESENKSFLMIDSIIEDVKKLLVDKKLLYRRSDNYDKIKSELLSMVPTSTANSLADVTNAAWEVYFIEGKWQGLNLSNQDKVGFLNELTTKSFEILEIRQRLQQK